MNFKEIPSEYRPIPFWSWNEKLSEEETRRQVRLMKDAGMGGFFMHARGGLETEYMGKEWFDNVEAAVSEGEKCGVAAWAYDENGWPSGFGNGEVNGLGEDYQQKYLRRSDDCGEGENTVAVVDGKRFYYEVNPLYVDLLNPKVTEAFLEKIYEPYYLKYKNRIKGFFTDEPQIARAGVPWSSVLPGEYMKAYGEELYPHLNELFEDVGEFEKTRIRFWKLITELFSKNFFKKIYDWCCERGLEFTGHLLSEETFRTQLLPCGACMPHYEYFTMPGMDWLGRRIIRDITALQLGSAAQQLGKKHVLSEIFALSGHGISFEEMKGMFESQLRYGVNLMCQHLEGYSLRGIRKRDYPPAMFYQQPWWGEYKTFCDSISRIGMTLANGKAECDALLIHPQTTVWSMFVYGRNAEIDKFYDEFEDIVADMNSKHILFHLGDEILMERHGRVENGKLIIGEMSYKTVILPPHKCLFENTKRLLDEFKRSGGTVINYDETVSRTSIVDNPEILYTKRIYDGYSIYYFINPTKTVQRAKIPFGATIIDIKTGDEKPFCGEYEFCPYESLLVKDDGTPQSRMAEKKELPKVDLGGKWHIDKASENILTLDYCDWYFDDELQEKNGYVLNIQNRAMKLKRSVKIKQVYRFNAETVPEELFLVCETPEVFEIRVNGEKVNTEKVCGNLIDSAFKKLDIAEFAKVGENEICFETLFCQSAATYDSYEKAVIFESERNKLTFSIEIEPCYLAGSFGVRFSGKREQLENNAIRLTGDFSITEMPEYIELKNIESQGFPFFAGELTLSKKFGADLSGMEVAFEKTGVNAVEIGVNGKECETLLWYPFKADISELLIGGENTLSLKLYNNLRNMLGPHHLEMGESYRVTHGEFFKEENVWAWGGGDIEKGWNDGYCLIETSVK